MEKLLPICDYLVSAGGTDEKMHLFCGLCDLQGKGGLFGLKDESEDIQFHVWSYNKAVQAHQSGRLNSAAATIGMLWLQLNYGRLGKQVELESVAQID